MLRVDGYMKPTQSIRNPNIKTSQQHVNHRRVPIQNLHAFLFVHTEAPTYSRQQYATID